jgi:hypothetical protein
LKLKFVFPCMLLAFGGLFLCQKNPASTADTPSATPIANLALQNGQLSGWDADTGGSGGYTLFLEKDSLALFSEIDGGATEYQHTVSGYSKFLVQKMMDSSMTLTIYIIDYSNSANSAGMFDYTKTRWALGSDFDTLSKYAASVAIGELSHSPDIWVCAHFKQFYIELRFSGFSDHSLAKQEAVRFLDDYKAKIN